MSPQAPLNKTGSVRGFLHHFQNKVCHIVDLRNTPIPFYPAPMQSLLLWLLGSSYDAQVCMLIGNPAVYESCLTITDWTAERSKGTAQVPAEAPLQL